MQVEIEGTITKVLPMQEGTSQRTGNAWRRQDYVLETPGQYTRKCVFTVANDNIEQFALTEGKSVKVTISIDAHEYNGRWYNDFRCVGVAAPTATTATPTAPVGQPAE